MNSLVNVPVPNRIYCDHRFGRFGLPHLSPWRLFDAYVLS